MPCSKLTKKAKRSSEKNRHREWRGQSLVEAMIGFLVLIPIGLMVVDLVTVLSATQANEQWAETAARAAACRGDMMSAKQAAEVALQRFQPSNVMNSIQVDQVQFDPAKGQVTVSTIMEVTVPVPSPLLNKLQCHAASVQPIVAIPASI